jgi:hypothetical protein
MSCLPVVTFSAAIELCLCQRYQNIRSVVTHSDTASIIAAVFLVCFHEVVVTTFCGRFEVLGVCFPYSWILLSACLGVSERVYSQLYAHLQATPS